MAPAVTVYAPHHAAGAAAVARAVLAIRAGKAPDPFHGRG